MSEQIVYFNGRMMPESQVGISIHDRGLQAGIGVFERTRTFNGLSFRLDEHLRRLDRSMRVTRVPAGMSIAEIKERTLEVLEANKGHLGPHDDFSIAHFITLGVAGNPTVIIFTQKIAFTTFANQYITGAHVISSPVEQSPISFIDPKVKTTSRMHHHLALQFVRNVDPDAYPLFLDHQGNVCELNVSNIWIVRDGVVVSPPGRSILHGITRDVVFEVAANAGIPTEERDFQVYDMVLADEAFFSGTSACVMPVTKVNGLQIGDAKPGPIVGRLQQGFCELTGVDVVQQALAHLAK
jgi:branched-chain amino acid aminotransferase